MNIEQIATEVSDELVKSWQQSRKMPPLAWDFRGFAIDGMRRCLSKMAEQSGVEPLGTANELLDDYVLYRTGINPCTKLYTETQLLAAQQRTAEACAKAVFEQAKYFGYNAHAEAVRDAALNKWREYL